MRPFVLILIAAFAVALPTPFARAADEGSLAITNETDATLFFVMDSGGQGDTKKVVSFGNEAAVEKNGFILDPIKAGQPQKTASFKASIGEPTLRVYLVSSGANLGKPVAQDKYTIPKVEVKGVEGLLKGDIKGNLNRKIKVKKDGDKFKLESD